MELGRRSHTLCITLLHLINTERDGADVPTNPDHIFLTAGASQGVQFLLQSIIKNSSVGVMIPIPQYPLYTASLALYEGRPVEYFLDEESGWSLSVGYRDVHAVRPLV